MKARLSADNNQIAIVYDGELDGSPIVFEWSDKFFDETNQKTQLDARGYEARASEPYEHSGALI